MTIADVVRQLNAHKIFPYVDDGKLKTKSSKAALTPELVKLIKQHKDELIAFLSQDRQAESSNTLAPIPTISRERATFPLSFAQQRLWLVTQVETDHSQYNVNNALVLEGELNVAALQSAFNQILQRHEILRCTYHSEDGTPVQQIETVQTLPIQRQQCVIEDPHAEQKAIQQLADKDALTNFDLVNDLMLRVRLVGLISRNNSERSLLLINMHHIASDGWSMGVLTQEFIHYYQAALINSAPTLPALTSQYLDFAAWQREKQQNGEYDKQVDFWQAQLKGLPTIHSLPLDKPRPAQQSYAGDVVIRQLNQATLTRLTALAQQQGATLFMLLETAFALLISRWSREDDVVIGTPIAGRVHTDVEPLIGFFVNTLVLRTQFTADENFTQLLARNQQAILKSFDCQDVPFETLVELLQPERSTSYSPLFQIMFALQNNANSDLALPNLAISPVNAEETSSKFELNVMCAQNPDSEGGLACYWNYSTALFSAESVAAMADAFTVLLTHIAENPDAIATQIPLVEVAPTALFKQHQATLTDTDINQHVLADFLSHAQKQPNHVAIVDPQTNERINYQALAETALNIAAYIDTLAVAPDAIIGVYFPRSIAQISTIMGILLSGRAYLPLDLHSLASRNQYIVEDSDAPLLITCHAVLADAKALAAPQLVCIDDDAVQAQLNAVDSDSIAHIHRKVSAFDTSLPAFYVYTSGSTGKPKGTVVAHRNVSHFNQHFLQAIPMDNSSVIGHSSNIAWDASTIELWMALSHGARIVLIEKDTYVNPVKLAACYQQFGVTGAFVTTAILNQMAAEQADGFGSLHTLCFGGEKVDIHAVNKILAAGKPTHLKHCYGPTENTTISTFYEITESNQFDYPIGKAIDGIAVLILDEQQQPVPEGMQGELYLGGRGVVTGYYKQAEMTEKAFVTLPELCPDTVYRTGDLVRLNAQGQLMFVGRVDDQVKLRGFRIELGEIAANLTEREEIDKAFIILHGEGNNAFITAYFTSEMSIDPDTLRQIAQQQCEQNLPDYMRPSCYIALDAFPVNANGKIEKRELPIPEFSALTQYIAPVNATESQLQDIWGRLLKRDVTEVSCDSNFFAIGGHSLLATRMISQVHKHFGIELTVKQLFSLKTIQHIAALLIAQEGGEKTQQSVISVQRKDQPLPLSFSQSRLWFIDKMQQGSAQYNMQAPLLLQGELNMQALQLAINAIVQRHSVLRSSYVEVNGSPMQQAHEVAALPITLHDWQNFSLVDAQQQAMQLQADDLQQAFDLSSPHMLRVTVASLPQAHYFLLITQHHIASDGWSTGVLLRELQANYAQALTGNGVEQIELAVQYADFATWQREQLAGDKLVKEADYWQQTLQGMPELHSLPLDKQRPAQQSFIGASLDKSLSASKVTQLRALANRFDMSLFMLLETLYAIVVYRFSGNDDVVIGSPIAGRNHPDVEPLIGFFVNNLVLRTQLDGEQSFAALFQQQKQQILAAFAHQNLPFEMLVEKLQPERDARYNPLFQLCFALQNLDVDAINLPGLSPVMFDNTAENRVGSGADNAEDSSETADDLKVSPGVAKFDLNLIAFEADDGLILQWNYAVDLFKPRTIDGLATAFELIVDACLADPQQSINACSIVSAQEQARLITLQQGAVIPRDAHWRLQDCVETTAQRTPNAIALTESFSERQLSYAEFNQAADRLATRLIERGVVANSLVVVSIARSIELYISQFAVLKAGAGFVPIDPNYPAERIQFMLDDSATDFVLCAPELAASLAINADRWISPMITPNDDVDTAAIIARREQSAASDAAYAIYSSGSTGQPKASITVHEGIGNTLRDSYIGSLTEANSRTLAFASCAFDASIYEWGNVFNHGGELIIIDEDDFRDPSRLDALGARYKITHGFFAPSVINALDIQHWSHLKVLTSGGESCSATLAKRWSQQCEVHNLYGPSEVSIISLASQYSPELDNFPIGRPLSNISAYILNDHLQLQPAGCTGELYLSGAGLARCYWQRDALNARHFVEATIGSSVQRLYRTGDLVRQLPNGLYEYLGRVDDQVKVRGLRIELGEIEMALTALQSVNECVVLVINDTNNEPQIVAFLNTSLSEQDASHYCREQLSRQLPLFMVPNRFMVIEQFTLTPNGKIDKRLLASMDIPALVTQYIAPETAMETTVQSVWAQVLNLSTEQVSRDSQFFGLGGHSLLAAKVMTALRSQIHIDIPLRGLFEHTTLREFARYIESLQHGAPKTPITKIVSSDGDSVNDAAIAPLSFAQKRLWVLDQMEGGSAQYNMPFAFELRGTLNIAALDTALCQLIKRHQVLRSTYHSAAVTRDNRTASSIESAPFQQVQTAPSSLLKQAKATNETDYQAQVQQALQYEAVTAFDLQQSVVRAQLISGNEGQHALLVTLHHIAADGWSMSIFTRELMALYQSACSQVPAELPDLPIQYRDFAAWQHTEEQQAHYQQQLDYWLSHLHGLPTQHSLPVDYPRPAVQDYSSSRHIQTLDSVMTEQLQGIADSEQMSMFMLLQGVFAWVISRWSGEQDVAIGTPIAGRNREEVKDLIGCFINSLVLRNTVDESLTVQMWLQRSKALLLDAYEHQDVSFEQLVDELQPERSLNLTPLFQIMLVMQNNDSADISLSDVNMRPLVSDDNSVKYDLSVTITPYEGKLLVSWNYATSLFKANTIQRLAESFLLALQQVAANTAQTLSDIALVPAADLAAWHALNATDVPQPMRQQPITAGLQQALADHPHHIAVRDTDGEDTYQQLAMRAAWFQQQLPTTENRGCVAIYCQRHRAMLAAMVAILASGHSYILIEPSSPLARVQQIVDMTNASALIADDETVLAAVAEATSQSTFVAIPLLESESALAGTATQAAKLSFVEPELSDLAYLIFTSGSTGTPKGVQVPHRGLSDYCAFASQYYYQRSGKKSAQALAGSWLVTSHGFDISVPSLWLPLLHGDTVTLLPNTDVIETLGQQLQNTAAPVLLRMTPSHTQGLLAVLPANFVCQQPHAFIIGGEAFNADDATALQQHFPNAFIVNHYGPSETVVGSTWLPLADSAAQHVLANNTQAVLPIGRPMSNTKAYVVSNCGQLQPLGCVGELWISGDCVTDGYLQQPELTADKFVANSFNLHSSATAENGSTAYQRCYRTGDAVRFTGDVLTFLGRIDNQIKIRGFRIEASEIEAALMECAGIHQAAVAKHPEREALCAWVTLAANSEKTVNTFNTDQLKQQLQQRLPSYLIPNDYQVISTLPLSANGKVNYRGLPAIESSAKRELQPPVTATERSLAAMWSELLSLPIDQISITDNFFAIGGNSIQSIRLVSQINEQFACTWRAGQLFALHSIEQQAKALDGNTLHATSQSNSTPNSNKLSHWSMLQQGETKAPALTLVHPVGGDIAAYPALVNCLPNNWQVQAIAHPDFSGSVDNFHSIKALATRYCDELQQQQPQGEYHLAGWSMGGLIALEMARILISRHAVIGHVVLLDSGLSVQEDFWQQLQSTRSPQAQVTEIQQFLQQNSTTQAEFDTAYQVAPLAALASVEPAQQRLLLIHNLVASRECQQQLLAGEQIPSLVFISADHPFELCEKQRLILPHLALSTQFHHIQGSTHFTLLRDAFVPTVADIIQQTITHQLTASSASPVLVNSSHSLFEAGDA